MDPEDDAEHEARMSKMHETVWRYARDRSFELYRNAVRRGILDAGQAEGLMALWLETHPLEADEATEDAVTLWLETDEDVDGP